jgi:hypothetical protein
MESKDVTITLVLFSMYVSYVEANNKDRLIVVLSRHSHALRGYYHFHFFATFSL